MVTTHPKVIADGAGRTGWLGGLGIRALIPGADSSGGFSLVEHPLKPRALAAPLHRHSREDEYSFVLSGKVGALLGDDVVYAGPRDLVYKPRGQWHTFWNAGDEPASLLEIISPAGFERYFEELLALLAGGKPTPDQIGPIAQRYGLEIDGASIPSLCARFGVTFG